MNQRAYRAAHKAAGLCITCPRKTRPGRARCERCLETQRRCQARRSGRKAERPLLTHCRICGAELHGLQLTLCSDRCRRIANSNRRPRPEPVSVTAFEDGTCRTCYDLPHRRGDVEDRTADGGWRREGDVCPGCGLVRERQEEDLIMVAMASSAGFWSAAIPEAAE